MSDVCICDKINEEYTDFDLKHYINVCSYIR